MRLFSYLACLVVFVAACGGSAEPAAQPAAQSSATPVPDDVAASSESVDGVPEELAFVSSDVVIEGDTGVLVTPGETVAVDHLVHNTAARSRTVALLVDVDATSALAVELSDDSDRLTGGEIATVVSTVTVPDDAVVGQPFEYDVVVVDTDDIDRRNSTTVQLLVTDAVGERPDAGPDAAVTTTNERVLVYVVGDDTDPDGDLDISSVRVIAGGFSADELTTDGNGTINYVPFADVFGDDVVMYEVCDAEERCDTGLISITVER